MLLLPVAALFAFCTHGALGYGTGAPNTVCDTLRPGHGNNDATYTLTAGASTYTPGTGVTVTVDGTFKGLLLQVRKTDDTTTPYGTFSSPPSGLKTITCSEGSNTVTHTSEASKTDVTITWTPPADDIGEVHFVATVATHKNSWALNVMSTALTYTNVTVPATTTTTTPGDSVTNTTTTTSPTTTTTAGSGATTAAATGALCLTALMIYLSAL